ncbi:lipocalin-like domain-containing protein [Geoanaerobacter pelophilus]|uniref:lipocalin-like domain-containing protein n=1 Tax=Geoanaerobacter pelophilus TaxID=60036 RepID=UPI000A26C5E6|nr:lipocalin-like domain-containing protein [Geoanaerobacter pelophilus]
MRRLHLVLASFLIALSVLGYLYFRKGSAPEAEKTYSLNEALGGSAADGFKRAEAPRRFSFPADHGPHEGFRNEWWYFTGNLTAAGGRRFGYQLTFFRSALTPHPAKRESAWGTNEVFMAHFAVTDVEGKRFRFAERFSRAALGLAAAGGSPLAVRLEEWSAQETAALPWSVKLAAAQGDLAIDLDLSSVKPVILNGEGGLSRKSGASGNASYYYSIPRLATSGTVRVGGDAFKVSGVSWLDREWSTSALDKDQAGWDWFALHLADGRDIMYYQLRRRDGSSDPFSAGTFVEANGSSRHLKREEVQLEPMGRWTSPKSGASYPSGWRMRIPSQGIDIEVAPLLADQELAAGFRYWEGAVEVRGSTGGYGYLEMTGY